jgi:hypothetical protein
MSSGCQGDGISARKRALRAPLAAQPRAAVVNCELFNARSASVHLVALFDPKRSWRRVDAVH